MAEKLENLSLDTGWLVAYVKSDAANNLIRQWMPKVADGYFYTVTQIGSGSEEEFLAYFSLTQGHQWREIHRLGRNDWCEYISWSDADSIWQIEYGVDRILAHKERLTAHDLRLSLAVYRNLHKLGRMYCDITVDRLAQEAGLKRHLVVNILEGRGSPFFSVQENVRSYRFSS